MTKTDLEQLKARTDLVALVARHVELRPSGNNFVGRSLKNSDTTPSLIVWPESQTWKDFSGGGSVGGDAIEFLRYARGLSFKEALRELAAEAGLPVSGVSNADLLRFQQRRRIEDLLTEAATFYHHALSDPMRWEAFCDRGYSDQTIDSLLLGFGAPGLWEHLGQFSATDEERLSTGLFVSFPSGGRKDFFANRLIFPYWRGGRVVYLIGRRSSVSSDAEWDKPKYKKLPTRSDKHPYISQLIANDFFYGEDDARTDGELLICEGIADAIAAQQAGFRCISPVTTTFRAQDHDKLLRLTARAKRIIICNDNEENGAGERGALETATALHAVGRDVRIARIPRPAGVAKIDVNDLVRQQGPDALRAVIAAARELSMYLVECIPMGLPARELVDALGPVVHSMQQLGPLGRGEVAAAIATRFNLDKPQVKKQLADLERQQSPAQVESGGRPSIVISDRHGDELIAEAVRALIKTNDTRIIEANGHMPIASELPLLFERGGGIVGLSSERGQPCVSDLKETEIYGLLLSAAYWFTERTNRSGEVIRTRARPPRDVSKHIVAFKPAGLPELDAVIATPVFGRDGALITRPGYHASDRLWFHPDANLGSIDVPVSPSASDVADARTLIENELLIDFPFCHASDKAHAIAALLLPFARRLIRGSTPLHVIESPSAGSGKGMIANLVSIVATGSACRARSLPSQDDEVRKSLTSLLLGGRQIVLLDNLPEKRLVDSPSLATLLTTDEWNDRMLGETRDLILPNTALWMATANNPRFSHELTRRCIRIRIDSRRDTPWKRGGFRHHPLLEWVSEMRPALVRACLVLVQAWIAAGRPRGTADLGSFSRWASTLGGILAVAGIDGFLAKADEFYEAADEEGEAWREFTTAWWEKFGSSAVRVADLNRLCEEQDLLEDIRGHGSEKSQQSKLGRGLVIQHYRTYRDLRITLARDDGRKKGRHYALELADTPSAAEPAELPELSAEVDPWGDDDGAPVALQDD